MYDTEDDDTHLCLKCSATITGLKNYIAHRKQHCYKTARSDSALTSVASPTAEHPYEPSSLRADDFFSYLELQSIQAVIPSASTKVDHTDYDLEDAEDSDNDLYPPTSHTGGKWKPGWGPTARSDWKAISQHREVPLQATKEPAAIPEGFVCIGEPDLESAPMMAQAMSILNGPEGGLVCTESDVLAESGSGILLPSGLDTEFSDQLNAHLNDQAPAVQTLGLNSKN
ncbi:hypothetical protein HPB50_001340 [Hyalomma asiaticum]|uniref:Uncharacterized protein n=1 Tax=Hyalomma asiaticum TaxID=266040 RepID=A0ACB7TAJ3_HYAAI|nr:hypothetical protein HPB50_001340 [Hyalomma asiaticum]